MNNSILISWNDSISSRAALDYLVELPICPETMKVTLLHVYRKESASEELMGKKFTEKDQKRLLELLQNAKGTLAECGFKPENIQIKMSTEPYPTIAEGIIAHFKEEKYDMVVIGRKRMSKAEEFVMGDVSIKLVRALENAAILVVTTP